MSAAGKSDKDDKVTQMLIDSTLLASQQNKKYEEVKKGEREGNCGACLLCILAPPAAAAARLFFLPLISLFAQALTISRRCLSFTTYAFQMRPIAYNRVVHIVQSSLFPIQMLQSLLGRHVALLEDLLGDNSFDVKVRERETIRARRAGRDTV